MTTTDPLVAAWLDYVRLDQARTPATVAAYTRTLRTFPEAASASREAVEAWWRDRSGKSPATRRNELAALRSFYRWMVLFEHRPDDPTTRIPTIKTTRGVPRPISRADLARLLDDLPPDLRRAVCLGAYAGLRVSEAASVSWRDVDVETRRIRVTGKGGHTRLVGVSPVLLDSILPDTGENIVTGGEPYTSATLQRKVNRAIRRAGVDATFHALRHRFATQALSATNLMAVSRALGHASPATTAIYAATSDSDLDLIAEAVSR
jgi:site-specific recombinase XerD